MKVYGALLSPFVRKVAVFAGEKGLACPIVPHRGRDGLVEEFAKASPFGKIPAMVDSDGFGLCDSSAIVAYLEAKVPSPALLGSDAQTRGRVVWLDEFADTILAASGLKIVFNRLVGPKIFKLEGNEALAQEGEAELPRSFDYLESIAPDTGWLAGSDFTLGDIALASMLKTLSYVGHGANAASYPKTAAWYERVAARPAWAAVEAAETEAMAPLLAA